MSDAAAATVAAALAPIVEKIVGPQAAEVDREGRFPRDAIEALGEARLLGLTLEGDLSSACRVVEELARHCGSTAMVVLMHYAASTVLEVHGSEDVRRRIAEGTYLATLAFSEVGSRSMFWAPMSTARDAGGGSARLDAQKSWVTAAGQADGYVWSSRPLAAEGASTLWLVPGDAPGLQLGPPFDGLGLRGNESRPMTGEGVVVPADAMLGADGGGFDIMLTNVLPAFQVMSAAFSVGLADAATAAAAAHVGSTRFEHLDQSLAENLVTRSYVARMRVQTDQSRALLVDTLAALEEAREDAVLRVLEVKAAASEMATGVTELGMRACGGAAFRKEVGVERRFRDARASTVMAPTTDTLYDLMGRILCGLPLF